MQCIPNMLSYECSHPSSGGIKGRQLNLATADRGRQLPTCTPYTPSPLRERWQLECPWLRYCGRFNGVSSHPACTWEMNWIILFIWTNFKYLHLVAIHWVTMNQCLSAISLAMDPECLGLNTDLGIGSKVELCRSMPSVFRQIRDIISVSLAQLWRTQSY